MLKIYGSPLCPDCVQCIKELEEAGVEFLFLDICQELPNLKAFLKLRDENELFDPIKQNGQIGIPCLQREDGTITLAWDEYLK